MWRSPQPLSPAAGAASTTKELPLSTEADPVDPGATVGAWNALIRRARIGRPRKAFALIVSSYAAADGTQIHCGIARLAVDAEVGYSTARRYLAWLRDAGLVELVRHGSRRRRLSDEYRLTVHPSALAWLNLPDPDEYDRLRDDLREANRHGQKTRRRSALTNTSADDTDQRSPNVSAEPGPAQQDQRSPNVSAEPPDQRSPGTSSALTQDEPPPSLTTSPEQLTSHKPPPRDLRTDLKVVGPPATPNPDQRSPGRHPAGTAPPAGNPLPDRCPHGLRSRNRPDGTPSCALCRRGAPPATQGHLAPVIPLRAAS